MSRTMAAVRSAGIAHENGLLLNDMTALPVRFARVYGMLVVEASTDGVAFDDLITHQGSEVLYARELGSVLSLMGNGGRIS